MTPVAGCRAARWAAGPALVLALATGAAGQTTDQISGRVVAENTSRPIAGAQVVVEGLRIGVLTQQDGRYVIPSVPAGSHRLRVEFIGFGTATQAVTVTAGATVTADFTLKETAVSLEEIVVTGTAAESRMREVGGLGSGLGPEAGLFRRSPPAPGWKSTAEVLRPHGPVRFFESRRRESSL